MEDARRGFDGRVPDPDDGAAPELAAAVDPLAVELIEGPPPCECTFPV